MSRSNRNIRRKRKGKLVSHNHPALDIFGFTKCAFHNVKLKAEKISVVSSALSEPEFMLGINEALEFLRQLVRLSIKNDILRKTLKGIGYFGAGFSDNDNRFSFR